MAKKLERSREVIPVTSNAELRSLEPSLKPTVKHDVRFAKPCPISNVELRSVVAECFGANVELRVAEEALRSVN